MCRHPCHAAISLANRHHVLCILISRKWLRSWQERRDLVTRKTISYWYYSHDALHVAVVCYYLKIWEGYIAQSHDVFTSRLFLLPRIVFFVSLQSHTHLILIWSFYSSASTRSILTLLHEVFRLLVRLYGNPDMDSNLGLYFIFFFLLSCDYAIISTSDKKKKRRL